MTFSMLKTEAPPSSSTWDIVESYFFSSTTIEMTNYYASCSHITWDIPYTSTATRTSIFRPMCQIFLSIFIFDWRTIFILWESIYWVCPCFHWLRLLNKHWIYNFTGKRTTISQITVSVYRFNVVSHHGKHYINISTLANMGLYEICSLLPYFQSEDGHVCTFSGEKAPSLQVLIRVVHNFSAHLDQVWANSFTGSFLTKRIVICCLCRHSTVKCGAWYRTQNKANFS